MCDRLDCFDPTPRSKPIETIAPAQADGRVLVEREHGRSESKNGGCSARRDEERGCDADEHRPPERTMGPGHCVPSKQRYKSCCLEESHLEPRRYESEKIRAQRVGPDGPTEPPRRPAWKTIHLSDAVALHPAHPDTADPYFTRACDRCRKLSFERMRQVPVARRSQHRQNVSEEGAVRNRRCCWRQQRRRLESRIRVFATIRCVRRGTVRGLSDAHGYTAGRRSFVHGEGGRRVAPTRSLRGRERGQ